MRHIPIVWDYVAAKIMEISSISNIDFVNITAHFTCMFTGEKDNTQELRDRGYTDEAIKSLSKVKSVVDVRTMGLCFKKQLYSFKYELMPYVTILLENYEKGNLPYAGPISEQPAQVIEILNLMQAIKLDHQTKQQNKR